MFNFVRSKGRRKYSADASLRATAPVRSTGPTGQAGIHLVFRGLKFEPDAGIEQKGVFFKGLTRKKKQGPA